MSKSWSIYRVPSINVSHLVSLVSYIGCCVRFPRRARRGEDGQLGLGDTSDQDEPTYVDALRGVGVQQIACGSGHTVVLSTEGEVYSWGR
jgi:Regulator of chromosome condensation (RCC1) repeat